MEAVIISIGDELLIGQTINTNAGWMGGELAKVGIQVKQVLTISDQKSAIENAMTSAAKMAKVVLMTGGLGPTKDDITKKTIAEYFKVPLVESSIALENVLEIFKKYGREITPVQKLQALVPNNATVLNNKAGTAPGMWIEHEGNIFVSMPGVPSEMKYLMSHEVIPRLKSKFELPVIVHKTIMTQGEIESKLADLIEDIEDGLPAHIKIAYLPSPGCVKLRISASGMNRTQIEQEVESVYQQIHERIDYCEFSSEEKLLTKVVSEILQSNNQTIAVAESCTGGALGAALTAHSGASSFFKGGVLSYMESVKIDQLKVSPISISTHGVVSEQVAKEMALGVKSLLNTDYALATTGIAGPDGGTMDCPIGTVWIALATPQLVIAEKFQMGEGRSRVVEKSVLSALMMLFKYLSHKKSE